MLGRDGTTGIPSKGGGGGGRVTPVGGPVRSCVGGMMLRGTGWPLDDGVARPGWAVVAPLQAARAMVMPRRRRRRGDRFEVLGLVAATRACSQKVRAATYGTGSYVVRATRDPVTAAASAAETPLELLQLGAVVLRGARHLRLTWSRLPVKSHKFKSIRYT